MEIPYPILPEPQALGVQGRPTVGATVKPAPAKPTLVQPARPEVKAVPTTKTATSVKPHKSKKSSDADDATVFLIIALAFIVVIVIGYLIIRRSK